MKVFTKFEVDTIIRCLVIALLLLIHYVSLWPWHVTFWPCSVVIHGGSRGQPSTKFEDPTAIHSWVTTSDIWHYTTLMALRLRQMESSAKTMYGPVLKTTQLSAHAQNHASIERCRKSFTIIVLGDLHFPWIASNFGNVTAFMATFSHIFTAHAQKWLFMNFRLKFWHHHSIHWSRFPYRARYFRNLSMFSVDFCIGKAECPPYFYFRSSSPTDLWRLDLHAVVDLHSSWIDLHPCHLSVSFPGMTSFVFWRATARLFLAPMCSWRGRRWIQRQASDSVVIGGMLHFTSANIRSQGRLEFGRTKSLTLNSHYFFFTTRICRGSATHGH